MNPEVFFQVDCFINQACYVVKTFSLSCFPFVKYGNGSVYDPIKVKGVTTFEQAVTRHILMILYKMYIECDIFLSILADPTSGLYGDFYEVSDDDDDYYDDDLVKGSNPVYSCRHCFASK